MLAEIETAIQDYLQSKWSANGGTTIVNRFDIDNEFEDLLKYPAISIATSSIGIQTVTDGCIKMTPVISVFQAFKHVGKPENRRHGVYPIVTACIQLLSGNDLDLEIDYLKPVSCKEVFHAKLKELGAICFETQFETSFDIESIDDNDAVALLTEGISYYLGDENVDADATDIINY
ncbi:MAG: phage protein Gp37 [Candidatus Paceibacterota bacterium]|jgi:hypothetical protein